MTKSQDSRAIPVVATQKIISLIQGLPECLKMITSARTQFINDLNSALHDFLISIDTRAKRSPNQKLPLIILTLSDSAERTVSFMNKMFHSVVSSHAKFRTLKLNEPTDLSIDKVLRQIVRIEGVKHLTDGRLIEIRTQAQRDLRNAIMTLQFSSAGHQQVKHMKRSFGATPRK